MTDKTWKFVSVNDVNWVVNVDDDGALLIADEDDKTFIEVPIEVANVVYECLKEFRGEPKLSGIAFDAIQTVHHDISDRVYVVRGNHVCRGRVVSTKVLWAKDEYSVMYNVDLEVPEVIEWHDKADVFSDPVAAFDAVSEQ